MELTWPLELHLRVSYARGHRWNFDFDAAIYISSRHSYVYGAAIFKPINAQADTLIVQADTYVWKFSKQPDDRLFIGNMQYGGAGSCNLRAKYERFIKAATGPPIYEGGPAEYCDVPQKILALVAEQLPGPIAEEVTPHLCASVRTIIGDTTI